MNWSIRPLTKFNLSLPKINDMKTKLGSKVALRKIGKAKVESDISAEIVNSAKRKLVK